MSCGGTLDAPEALLAPALSCALLPVADSAALLARTAALSVASGLALLGPRHECILGPDQARPPAACGTPSRAPRPSPTTGTYACSSASGSPDRRARGAGVFMVVVGSTS